MMMMGFGFLGTVLLIALVAFLLGWRPEGSQDLFSTGGSSKSAVDILAERYARGEISKQEFDQMKQDLS